MEAAVRMHIRRQIDAAARKREGLPARKMIVVRQPQDASRRWSDGEILAALKRVAKMHGTTVGELRMGQYRKTVEENPGIGPSRNALKKRLAAGIAGCPERLQ